MKNLVFRVRKRLERSFFRASLGVRPRRDLRYYGSHYGGWVVPTSLFSASSICYCVGVGEDITFDLALIETFGCHVFAFDPTPRAVQHVEKRARNVLKYHFYDVGLWSTDRKVRFYAPKDPGHVSYSIVNLQQSAAFFVAECKRLSSLMENLGHSRLDLLKLDIEGAEYEVIDSLLEDKIDVSVLCVEFDQPTSGSRVWKTVRRLQKCGYTLVNIDRWNYTFVSEKAA